MPTPIITIILDSEDDPYIYEPPPPPEANDANSNSSNSIIDTSNTITSNSNTIIINTSTSNSNVITVGSNTTNSNTIALTTNTSNSNSNTIVIGANTETDNANTSNVSYAYFEFHPKLFVTKQMQVIDTVTKIITTFDEIEKEVTSHYYPKRAVTDEFKTEVYAQMRVLQKAIRRIIKRDMERLSSMIEQAIKDYKATNQPPFTTSILNEIRQGFVDETEKLETIIIYYPEACLPKEQYQNFVTRLQAFSTIKEFIIATRDEDLFNTEPQPPQIVV